MRGLITVLSALCVLIAFISIQGCFSSSGPKQKASGVTNEFTDKISKADCGSLTQSDCSTIKEWYKDYLAVSALKDKQTGGAYMELIGAIGISDYSDGRVDNENQPILLREFKQYCYDAKWQAQDCKAKIFEFMALFKKARDSEVERKMASEKSVEDAKRQEEQKMKAAGY